MAAGLGGGWAGPVQFMQKATKPKQTYDRWSRVYDRTFGTFTQERLRCAIGEMNLQRGDRVLDLGIGTGTTLDLYPAHVRVTGIDLSIGMLRRAKEKIRAGGIHHVSLLRGDALHPPFANHSFDHVMISHVISVVSDPQALLHAAARMVRPGGRVIVVNHFQSRRRPLAALGKALNPLCMKLGWRSDLCLDRLLSNTSLIQRDRFKLGALDLWQVVVLESPGNGVPADALSLNAAPAVAI